MLIFPPRKTVRGGYGRGGKYRFITPVLDADPQWQSPAYRDFKWSSTRSMCAYSFLTAEAEGVREKIEALKAEEGS